ncbi:MAG: hypothetical protein QOE77_34 [Blastocatellia bacterium]|jgi:hypothetical protein|nr:hypothetical protein [Blastocatellia bacterium]
MKTVSIVFVCLIGVGLVACSTSRGDNVVVPPVLPISGKPSEAPRNSIPLIHVFVALCDNVNQGIVPVSASLGNGDNPATNLYWGAAFGVKTFFSKSKDWQLLSATPNPQAAILERLVFKHRTREVVLVADAYRGKEIKSATLDFLGAAAGQPGEQINLGGQKPLNLNLRGSADLVVYIGHDGLMDFTLNSTPTQEDQRQRKAIILACASKQYFSESLKRTGASPLLWTTNLMAPEAYVLSAAIDGWIKDESDEEIRLRAAKAYHSYQHCGLKSANNLFATGW